MSTPEEDIHQQIQYQLPPGAIVHLLAIDSDGSVIDDASAAGTSNKKGRVRSFLLPSRSRLFRKKKKEVSWSGLTEHHSDNIDSEVDDDPMLDDMTVHEMNFEGQRIEIQNRSRSDERVSFALQSQESNSSSCNSDEPGASSAFWALASAPTLLFSNLTRQDSSSGDDGRKQEEEEEDAADQVQWGMKPTEDEDDKEEKQTLPFYAALWGVKPTMDDNDDDKDDKEEDLTNKSEPAVPFYATLWGVKPIKDDDDDDDKKDEVEEEKQTHNSEPTNTAPFYATMWGVEPTKDDDEYDKKEAEIEGDQRHNSKPRNPTAPFYATMWGVKPTRDDDEAEKDDKEEVEEDENPTHKPDPSPLFYAIMKAVIPAITQAEWLEKISPYSFTSGKQQEDDNVTTAANSADNGDSNSDSKPQEYNEITRAKKSDRGDSSSDDSKPRQVPDLSLPPSALVLQHSPTDVSQYGFETADSEKPFTIYVTHPDQYEPSSTNTPREERVRTRLSIPSFYAIPRSDTNVSSFGFEASDVDDPDISVLLSHPVQKTKKKQRRWRRGGFKEAEIPNVELVGVPGREGRNDWLTTPSVYECNTIAEEAVEKEGRQPGEAREQATQEQKQATQKGDEGQREAPEEKSLLTDDEEFEKIMAKATSEPMSEEPAWFQRARARLAVDEGAVPPPISEPISEESACFRSPPTTSKGFDELITEFDKKYSAKLVRTMMCVSDMEDAIDLKSGRREKFERKDRNAGILDDISLTSLTTVDSKDTIVAIE